MDAEALYDEAHVPPSASGAASTAIAAPDASAIATADDNGDSVHGIALGIEDAEELLRRHALEAVKSATTNDDVSDTEADSSASAQALPATLDGAHPSGSASAVYRFYEIEATLSLKRREESSIARCRLCRQEGRVERKSCVRFSKSVTSNLWRHLKENHPAVYEKHVGEKKTVQMHKLVSAKKRGRKRKASQSPTEASASGLDESERFLQDVEGDEEAAVSTDGPPRKTSKRSRRQPSGEHFFSDYALAMSGSSALTPLTGGESADQKRASFNPDRIREAAAFMCLHEMVPFEVCSSVGFRSLLTECQVPAALVADAATMSAVFGKQVIEDQARKLVSDVYERTCTAVKGVDGAHIQLVEWRASRVDCSTMGSFIGVFAVGLDEDFNHVRRCISVLAVDPVSDGSVDGGSSANDSLKLKKALELISTHSHAATLAIGEPRDRVEGIAAAHKMDIFESIPSILHDVILSTITGGVSTSTFAIGMATTTRVDPQTPFHRAFETDQVVDSIVATGDNGSVVESSSPILTELPNVLTGHTIRDIILKALHLMAHIKQAQATRVVMLKIFVDELGGDQDTFTELVETLRAIRIGVQTIYEVLTLTIKIMPTLQRYFDIHKDGTSDLSKLMQLASLSTYEWDRVGHLASLLKPFADAVANLQQEKYIVSSLIIPTVYTLLEKLRSSSILVSSSDGTAADLPEDMAVLKTAAHAQLSSTFGYLYTEPANDWSPELRRSFNWLWSATLLDPRTRPFIIKGPLTQAHFWDLVKHEAASIAGMNKLKAKGPDGGVGLPSDGQDPSSAASGNGSPAQRDVSTRDLWDDLQANLASCAEEEMLLASSKSALELAKSTNLLEVEISFLQEESRILLTANPLEWWQTMRLKYPYVARLARYVLSIPGRPPVDENPLVTDSGLMSRLSGQVSTDEVCAFVNASINLRLERQHAAMDAAARQSLSWTTV